MYLSPAALDAVFTNGAEFTPPPYPTTATRAFASEGQAELSGASRLVPTDQPATAANRTQAAGGT